MSKMVRRFVAPVLLASTIMGVAVTAANAAIVYPPEGGTWDRGAGTSYVWSEYYHRDICHGSTAVGKTTVRDSASAGHWAIARAQAKLSGNETYYRAYC